MCIRDRAMVACIIRGFNDAWRAISHSNMRVYVLTVHVYEFPPAICAAFAPLSQASLAIACARFIHHCRWNMTSLHLGTSTRQTPVFTGCVENHGRGKPSTLCRLPLGYSWITLTAMKTISPIKGATNSQLSRSELRGRNEKLPQCFKSSPRSMGLHWDSRLQTLSLRSMCLPILTPIWSSS